MKVINKFGLAWFCIGMMAFPLLGQEVLPPVIEGVVEGSIEEVDEESEFNDTEFGTAVALSQTVANTTGIAMSPLLGMGALGAWQYFRADEAMRDSLPWYTAPWVWGACLGVIVMLKSKDFLGAFIPEMAKKPITVIDDIQDKASALIVALAVIPPAVLNEFDQFAPQSSGTDSMAMVPFVLPIVAIVACIAVFLMVWLVFHSFSSIKMISPSAFVNTTLSVIKGVILSAYAFFLALNPWIALAMALVVIVLCALIFKWAFRWNVFGAFFVKDFITGSFQQPVEDGEKIKGFATGHFPGVKARTYGELRREGDELLFTSKAGLIGPRQTSRVPIDDVSLSMRKGIFQPSITFSPEGESASRSLFDLRLRYRSHEEQVGKQLSIDSVTPNLVIGSLLSGWQWIKDEVRHSGEILQPAVAMN